MVFFVNSWPTKKIEIGYCQKMEIIDFNKNKKMKELRSIFTLVLLILPGLVSAQNYSRQVVKEYEAGQKAYQNQADDVALAHFNKCIDIDSTCFEAFVGIASIQYQKGAYRDAISACKTARKFQPNYPSLFSITGKSYLEIGEYELAEDQLQKAIALGDDSDENKISLARTYVHLNKFNNAATYYDELNGRNNENVEYWYFKGNHDESKDDFETAKSAYERVLSLDSDHYYANLRLISVLIQLAEFDTIPALIESAESKASTDEERINLYLIEGYYHQQNKAFDLAEAAYEKAYDLDNSNIPCLIYYSALYLDKEEYENAVEKCNEVIDLDPENHVAYFNRGIANEMLRNLEQACMDWEEAFFLGSLRAVEYLNSSICNE